MNIIKLLGIVLIYLFSLYHSINYPHAVISTFDFG